MSRQEVWQPVVHAPPLAEDQVQVWRVPLQTSAETLAGLERSLSSEELARADRFRFARDRRGYVVTRAVLRALLARVLALEPSGVRLQLGPQGKPFLAQTHHSDVQFNVAHSHQLALIALTRGPQLGVDVEYRRDLDDAQRIAKRFFSKQEVNALLAAPAARQHERFFRIWTRKEAFIKATGKGLSQPLGAFNVISAGGRPLSHVELDGVVTDWRLCDLFPGTPYAAALVWDVHDDIFQYHYQL